MISAFFLALCILLRLETREYWYKSGELYQRCASKTNGPDLN